MNFLFAVFFGAGVAAFSYTRMGRRVGYGNTGNVTLVTGIIFVLSAVFFYTILRYFLHVS
jgi:hypothetical protein